MNGEYESEPVKGLPERLPPGERILWQGSPRWQALAVHAFHARKVAVYFGLLVAWRIAAGLAEGEAVAQCGRGVAVLIAIGAAGVGLLTLLAWLNSRAAVYTITNRRVAMRFGVALPMIVNVPYRIIDAAALRLFADGSGDVPLTLNTRDRIAWLHLWPHVRPWRLRRPEPALRAVPQAPHVAKLLADALAASAGGGAVPVEVHSATPARDGRPLVPAAT
jgi:hypothetical protein